MSRKLMRVPLNFSWPLNEVWGGYLNPYYALAGKCPDCENGNDRARGRSDANAALFNAQWYGNAPFDPFKYGAKSDPLTQEHPAWRLALRNVERAPDFYMDLAERRDRAIFRRKVMEGFGIDDPPLVPLPGYNKMDAANREARRLFDMWRGCWSHHLIQADVDALVAADRLWDFTHRPRNEEQAQKLRNQEAAGGSRCWLDESNGYHPTADEVNAWSFEGFGHDSFNAHVCVRARCEREGVPFQCVRCAGSGQVWPTPEIKQKCDDWQETAPPTGDGYQLWEDCTEGSPVSPVFGSLDELCAWAEIHYTTFADFKASKEKWKQMLEDDCVHAEVGGNIYK